MEEEGAHYESAAAIDGAGDWLMMLFAVFDLIGIEAAVVVGAGEDAEGAVGFIGAVQVNSQSEHVFQDGHGWLDVMDAGFEGPWTVAVDVEAFADCDG